MKLTSQKIEIVAITENCKIKGAFYISEDSRLTDVLNSNTNQKDFIALNDATITNLVTSEVTNVPFLSLNKNCIEIIYEEK